jgi:hypothetical protein
MADEFVPSKEHAGCRVMFQMVKYAAPEIATIDEMLRKLEEQKCVEPQLYAEAMEALRAIDAEVEMIIAERMEALRG